MKKLPLLFCCLVFLCGCFSAHSLSKKGFTDKLEAKNLMANGLKEGKWIEYPYIVKVSTPPHEHHRYRYHTYPVQHSIDSSYRLTIYHNGIPTGTVRDFYPDGVLRQISYYSNGKYNGVCKSYYRSGKIQVVSPCTNGKGNGVTKVYYESGRLQAETPFTDGVCNGVAKSYYENGNLWSENPITNGSTNGVLKEYYENGKLKRETPYTNGKKGIAKNYNGNGNEITVK